MCSTTTQLFEISSRADLQHCKQKKKNYMNVTPHSARSKALQWQQSWLHSVKSACRSTQRPDCLSYANTSPRFVQNIRLKINSRMPKAKNQGGQTNIICTHTLENSETSFLIVTSCCYKQLLSWTHASSSSKSLFKVDFLIIIMSVAFSIMVSVRLQPKILVVFKAKRLKLAFCQAFLEPRAWAWSLDGCGANHLEKQQEYWYGFVAWSGFI